MNNIDIDRYITNLDEIGVRQALRQLLIFPGSREFIMNSIVEMKKFYTFPVIEKGETPL